MDPDSTTEPRASWATPSALLAVVVIVALGAWTGGRWFGAVEPTISLDTPIAMPADGRLELRDRNLPRTGILTIAIPLPREALGTGPLWARIAGLDGRALESEGRHATGAEPGVEIEIDLHWLRPGDYLIEIRTAEQSAIPLRRFVLAIE